MNALPSYRHSRQRGSALLTVIFVTTIMALLAASLIGWSLTERRLNVRNAMRLESRNAAEALAEYGFSQIRLKLETRSNFSLNPTGSDALTYPPASFWTGSHVNAVIPSTVNTGDVTYNATNLELIGGTIVNVVSNSGGLLYYIDPNDVNNQFDPLKGKYVFRRDVSVIARATIIPTSGAQTPLTSYVMEKISVRGAPLFSHAIFYNMDLEIFPGPNMTISGPVHSNGSLYLYPGNGSTLAFTDQVTCTGGIYHAAAPYDVSSDGASAAARTGSITIPNKATVATNLYSTFWQDTTQGTGTAGTVWSNFRTNASQVWNGNLQTGAFGIQNYSPVAVGAYAAQTTTAVDNSINTGRTLIEPPNTPAIADPNYNQKTDIEYQKYSSNAGIYIQVTPSTGTITVSSRSKSYPTTVTPLAIPAGSNLVTIHPYNQTTPSTTTGVVKTYAVGAMITSGTNKNKYPLTTTTTTTTTPSTTTVTSSGTTTTPGTPSVSPSSVVTYVSSSTPPSTSSSTSTSTGSTTLNSGMYDQHRQMGIDTVDLNMDAFRNAVAVMAGQATYINSAGTSTAVDPVHNVFTGLTTANWTGIVYVEVTGAPTTDPITGATYAASSAASLATGVRLLNGTNKLPSYGTANPGLTIATNAPVYIKGNYNADGNTNPNVNGSADPSVNAETGEVPACIAADAITILSPGFSDATSLSSFCPAASATVEISAAFLTGITPSNKNGNTQSSGGAHNLPRFLENWSGKSTYIRGSLVCLFESRVFTQPYNASGYYSPPTRNWGFNSLFRAGIYPPGTPSVQSYRRIDFTDLTPAAYAAQRAQFGW